LIQHLRDPAVLAALRLSLVTAASATAVIVVLGAPAAWLLATREFRGKRILEALVQVPMVLPPTVAGLALLLAFGRFGLAGRGFGATLTFAGNLPGTTQTLPLAVYTALQSDLDTAAVLAVLLLAISIVLLVALRLAPDAWPWSRTGARD